MDKHSKFQERLNKVVERLQKTEMDALFLNKPWNVGYLTGAVNPCSWLFITRKGERVALIWEPDLDVYKTESIVTDVRVFRDMFPFGLFREVTEELGLSCSKIGLELGRPGISHPNAAVLKHAFPSSVEFLDGETLLEEIRAVKTKDEIEAIGRAVKIVELGMETAIKTINPGIKESDVALEAEYAMRKAGGKIPVANYVASGKRSGLSHQFATQKKIEKDDVVILDIHGSFEGYCADLARTVVCGKIDEEVKRAYSHLVKAEEEVIQLCRKGTKLVEIRKCFYKNLAKAKPLRFLMGPPFHGIGVMPSELPGFLFPYDDKGNPEELEANMVIATSGVGLYSPKGWGVRAEDMVWVTEKDPLYLTHFPRELLSI